MSSFPMNKYWIRGFEIDKNVITRELQLFLGPQASVRPFSLQGIEGYLITTPGPCITDAQIDDICRKSRQEVQRQAEARWRSDGPQNESLKRPINAPITISLASEFDNSRPSRSPERGSVWPSSQDRSYKKSSSKRFADDDDDDYDDWAYGYNYESKNNRKTATRRTEEKRPRSPGMYYGGESRRFR